MNNEIIAHYDILIDEQNDPVRDPKPLRDYMNKWDGDVFHGLLGMSKDRTALEIGVGTGRLAMRCASKVKHLTGIDISPKTIERAKENLADSKNVTLICGDFMTYEFNRCFDIIYSSLTFMHIEDKHAAVKKISGLLTEDGKFVVSIDKNQNEYIDFGTRKIKIYPDTPDQIKECIDRSGMKLLFVRESEHAYIITAQK